MSDFVVEKNQANTQANPSEKKEGFSSFKNKKSNNLNNKKKTKLILGFLSLLLLILGGAIGLYMTKISQDLRQQADVGDYSGTGDVCTASGGQWVGNLCWMGGSATCAGPGQGGGDPCAANGGICSGTNVIRCQCGNAWVAGKAGSSCSDLCGEANLNCDDDCTPTNPPRNPTNPPPNPTNTPTPRPTRTPTPTPSAPPSPTPTLPPNVTPTVTPTIVPTIIPGCGFGPCTDNSGCDEDLICVTADNGNSYCSLPEYEAACILEPGVEACCTAPTTTPTTPPNEPTTEPTATPTQTSNSSSSSSSSSSSTALVNITNNTTTSTATNRYVQTTPTLPPELPKSGPEDWLQYLQIGLGALGVGVLLLLFL